MKKLSFQRFIVQTVLLFWFISRCWLGAVLFETWFLVSVKLLLSSCDDNGCVKY